jgi:putative SOS response-associated peptidase YedK
MLPARPPDRHQYRLRSRPHPSPAATPDLAQAAADAFAGLWECWHNPEDNGVIESCTILTTAANELMRPLHDRMPVIVSPDSDELWLNPGASPDVLRSLLVPYPDAKMEAFAVNDWVSNSRHEGKRCLEPVSP